MASVNSKIKTVDYNNAQNRVNTVLGPTNVNSGYGQLVQSLPVSTGNKVSVDQFAALRFDIINAYRHIYGTSPSNVDAKTISDKIRYSTSTQPIDYWERVLINDIQPNKLDEPPISQRISTNHGARDYTLAWADTLQADFTVSFTSAENARKFFNSGGTVRIESSRTGGSSSQQNTSWTSLLSTAGERVFGANQPTTGLGTMNGGNFYRLTNVFQSWSSVTASGPYSLNDWTIFAKSDVANNSTGTATTVTFRIQWNDDHEAQGGPPAEGTVGVGTFGPDVVDGTLSYSVVTFEAFGALQPASAGNFEVETPAVSLGSIAIPAP